MAEFARRLAAGRVDRGGVPVRAPVNRIDHLIEAVDLDQAHDGTEYLLPLDRHLRSDGIEDRRSDEEARVSGHFDAAAVEGHLRTLLHLAVDETEDTVPMGVGDHRTHLDGLVQAVPDLDLRRGRDKFSTQVLVGLADSHDDGASEASLPCASVTGGDQVPDGPIEL